MSRSSSHAALALIFCASALSLFPFRAMAQRASEPAQEDRAVAAIPAPADVAKAPKNTKKTASGLAYRVLKKGTGNRHPTANKDVLVHFTCWTPQGLMFVSTVVTDEPVWLPIDEIISGWREGIKLMIVGEKTRFWIPHNLASGDTRSFRRYGLPDGKVVCDIELRSIKYDLGE